MAHRSYLTLPTISTACLITYSPTISCTYYNPLCCSQNIQTGIPLTAAPVNTKIPSTYRYDFCDGTWNTSINGLYLASLNGHPNTARLLLEAGINDSEYARGRESMPLYYALRQGHDAVALVLLEHFTDLKRVLS